MRKLTDFAGAAVIAVAVVVALLFINGCDGGRQKDIGLEYRVAANNVLLIWERQDSSMVYLVQGNYMDQGWDDLRPTYDPMATVRTGEGMFRFRVIGYGKLGKVFTSRPTTRIFMRANSPSIIPKGGRNFDHKGPRTSMFMAAQDSIIRGDG